MPGASTSAIEVSLISSEGFWLRLDNEELLFPMQNSRDSSGPLLSKRLCLSGHRPITFIGLS
ncbi:hypothetical protein PG1C_01455 [Rugosibacter aromaticivorans]|uniref:Uncharacterized protein n=1 Tax=Rugosibacter aromaticivorans TaxID=1565605 RepID=A0A0C5IXQ8_9PROT|nr:hypothetical protein PG1C_01455 [Rugosibacter aromaticivorans]